MLITNHISSTLVFPFVQGVDRVSIEPFETKQVAMKIMYLYLLHLKEPIEDGRITLFYEAADYEWLAFKATVYKELTSFSNYEGMLLTNPTIIGGSISGIPGLDTNFISGVATDLIYDTTITIDVSLGSMFYLTITGDSTLNASSAGTREQVLIFTITNLINIDYNVTFDANFRSNGSLVVVADTISTIMFNSNGNSWVELTRTENL